MCHFVEWEMQTHVTMFVACTIKTAAKIPKADGHEMLTTVQLEPQCAINAPGLLSRGMACQVGDGTTTVVILAGELLRECKAFVEEGVHPQARLLLPRSLPLVIDCRVMTTCSSSDSTACACHAPLEHGLRRACAGYQLHVRTAGEVQGKVVQHTIVCRPVTACACARRRSYGRSGRRARWRCSTCTTRRSASAARTPRSCARCCRSARRPRSLPSWCAMLWMPGMHVSRVTR